MGNTCSGIRIQRSADGYFFWTIGEIDGICGSSDAEIPYIFVDVEPLNNQTNYYRLELGTQGYSTILQIDYVPLNEEGYSLMYDITLKTATIYFSNPNTDLIPYNLISLSGSNVFASDTNGSQIVIDLSAYSVQIFLLRISTTKRIFSIKILAF